MMFEEFSKQSTLWLAGGIELCAGLLIGLAAIQATARSLWLFFARPKFPSAAHVAEGRKADVLVQDFDPGESDLARQAQLEHERAGRVLLFDVGEYMVPVGFALKPGQVLAVLLPHELLDGGD